LGLLLFLAEKRFRVPVDQRIEALRAALPGVNCGGCGRAGCDVFAAALSGGQAKPGECPACSGDQRAKLYSLLGMTPEYSERMSAHINCCGGHAEAKSHFAYQGLQDCAAAGALQGGFKACRHGCLGLGSCVASCPFGAISVDNDRGLAEISREKCRACRACLAACPRGIIHMIPYAQNVHLACNAADRGRTVRENCIVGCIGCGLCAKACPQNALAMVDSLPVIDYKNCSQCGVCVEKCPTASLTFRQKYV